MAEHAAPAAAVAEPAAPAGLVIDIEKLCELELEEARGAAAAPAPAPPRPTAMHMASYAQVLQGAGAMQVSQRDIDSVLDEKWLTGAAIEVYLRLLKLACRGSGRFDFFICPTTFYSQLNWPSHGYKIMKFWKYVKNMFQYDRIFVVVNHGNTHWTLAVIRPKQRLFQHYDGLLLNYDQRQEEVLRTLKRFVSDHCKFKNLPDPEVETWTCELARPKRDIPEQVDGFSCGVFVCTIVERIMHGEERSILNHPAHPFTGTGAQCQQLRRRIARALWTSTPPAWPPGAGHDSGVVAAPAAAASSFFCAPAPAPAPVPSVAPAASSAASSAQPAAVSAAAGSASPPPPGGLGEPLVPAAGIEAAAPAAASSHAAPVPSFSPSLSPGGSVSSAASSGAAVAIATTAELQQKRRLWSSCGGVAGRGRFDLRIPAAASGEFEAIPDPREMIVNTSKQHNQKHANDETMLELENDHEADPDPEVESFNAEIAELEKSLEEIAEIFDLDGELQLGDKLDDSNAVVGAARQLRDGIVAKISEWKAARKAEAEQERAARAVERATLAASTKAAKAASEAAKAASAAADAASAAETLKKLAARARRAPRGPRAARRRRGPLRKRAAAEGTAPAAAPGAHRGFAGTGSEARAAASRRCGRPGAPGSRRRPREANKENELAGSSGEAGASKGRAAGAPGQEQASSSALRPRQPAGAAAAGVPAG
eukprot:tig00000430_g657.t2